MATSFGNSGVHAVFSAILNFEVTMFKAYQHRNSWAVPITAAFGSLLQDTETESYVNNAEPWKQGVGGLVAPRIFAARFFVTRYVTSKGQFWTFFARVPHIHDICLLNMVQCGMTFEPACSSGF